MNIISFYGILKTKKWHSSANLYATKLFFFRQISRKELTFENHFECGKI